MCDQQRRARRVKMYLDKVIEWVVGIVLAFALTGHLSTLQRWIWIEQAKVIHASRTSTWGDPDFLRAAK